MLIYVDTPSHIYIGFPNFRYAVNIIHSGRDNLNSNTSWKICIFVYPKYILFLFNKLLTYSWVGQVYNIEQAIMWRTHILLSIKVKQDKTKNKYPKIFCFLFLPYFLCLNNTLFYSILYPNDLSKKRARKIWIQYMYFNEQSFRYVWLLNM